MSLFQHDTVVFEREASMIFRGLHVSIISRNRGIRNIINCIARMPEYIGALPAKLLSRVREITVNDDNSSTVDDPLLSSLFAFHRLDDQGRAIPTRREEISLRVVNAISGAAIRKRIGRRKEIRQTSRSDESG